MHGAVNSHSECSSNRNLIFFSIVTQLGNKKVMEAKCKQTDLTIKQKMDVVKTIEEKKAQVKTTKEFGVSQNSSIMDQVEDDIRAEWQQSTIQDNRKRKRLGKNSNIEEGLYMWFQLTRCKNIPINGPLLMEKSKKNAKEIGKWDFKQNTGWLFRWKNRYSLAYKKAHGKSGDADIEGADEWIKDVYPSVVEGW